MTTEAGQGHSVKVAAGGLGRGVEICVGVKPQNAKLLLHRLAMFGYSGNGADGQAMISSHQNGQVPGTKNVMDGMVYGLVPLNHFSQMTVPIDGMSPGLDGPVRLP